MGSSSIKQELSSINDNSTFIRNIAIAVIAVIVFLSLPEICMSDGGHHHHDHDDHHHHDESNVPPSFKYSREANENFQKHSKVEGHGPQHHHHHDNDHDHSHGHSYSKTTNTAAVRDISTIWLHSMGSTLLISAAPYIVLFTIPLDNTEKMKPRLKVLLAFASGGLLGDAFLHLIPHSTVPHSHDHSHGHSHHENHSHSQEGHEHTHDMSVGLWVLSGIITFLAVEKGVRLIKGGHGHSHGSNHKEKDVKKDVTSNKKNDIKNKLNKIKSSPKEGQKCEDSDQVEISGYLNLVADFAHNFTDGLAIGASYLAGKGIGTITTITILFHEIPHEIGDFAILIKSGCSRRKAMFLQLVTALGALAGTALGLLGAGSDAAASWVLPFTAGGFIYIATVSVLPELLEGPTKLGQSLREISALLTGVGLMVVIANFE